MYLDSCIRGALIQHSKVGGVHAHIQQSLVSGARALLLIGESTHDRFIGSGTVICGLLCCKRVGHMKCCTYVRNYPALQYCQRSRVWHTILYRDDV